MLSPTFSLKIGRVSTSTASPVGGPITIEVDRSMDLGADALSMRMMRREGIGLGDAVALELGHDGENQTVFTGTVSVLRPEITGVLIQALGKINDLLNLRHSVTYENQTAGSIAGDLISRAGLSPGQVDTGPKLPRYAIDKRVSAYRHLRDLADRLGYELYADREGRIMFHALGSAAQLDLGPGGALSEVVSGAGERVGTAGEAYVFGRHLIRAQAKRRNSAWRKVEVGGESPMSARGETTVHWLTANDTDFRGAAGTGAQATLVNDPSARTKDLADRFAAGLLAVARRYAHEIDLTFLGRPQIDLGDFVDSSELPDDLITDKGYIRAVRHRFGEKTGYLTDVKISVQVES